MMIATQKLTVKLHKLPKKEETLLANSKVILVFSNTRDLRRIIQLSLEEIAGWKVLVSNLNVQEFALIPVVQPDVILLDTKLPNSDELELLQKIQNHPELQDIPLVLLTERIFSSDRKLYRRLGIVTAIAKPCDMTTLATKISQSLNWY